MFGFIKNWFKPKDFKEVKKEYKELKAKEIKWIAKAEELKRLEDACKAMELADNILDLCFGCLRPDQDDCPPLIIHCFKKLLEIGNEEALVRATNNLGMFLSESQQKDFTNKVSQLKEYKVWKEKKRLIKLNEDF